MPGSRALSLYYTHAMKTTYTIMRIPALHLTFLSLNILGVFLPPFFFSFVAHHVLATPPDYY